MKLFKRILLVVISFGIIFSSALSLHVFAEGDQVPATLEECCLALDKICTQEEKAKIKQSSVYHVHSHISKISSGRLGVMIRHDWLYLHEEGEIGRTKESVLAELLLAHGAGYGGEKDYVMSGIILENYSHYLNGEKVTSIEDLVIDHWFNFWHYFNSDLKREEFQERMERWVQARDSRKTQGMWSWCTIL